MCVSRSCRCFPGRNSLTRHDTLFNIHMQWLKSAINRLIWRHKDKYSNASLQVTLSTVRLCPQYSDVIIGAMAFQITSLTIVYSTVYTGADQIKHQSFAPLAFVRGNSQVTGEIPAQMASNAENVSIWWYHHVVECSMTGVGKRIVYLAPLYCSR